MKKIILSASLIIVALSTTSCRETKTETKVIREVEVREVETTDDDGILERTAKEIDKEVSKEINEEIDKIGDDN